MLRFSDEQKEYLADEGFALDRHADEDYGWKTIGKRDYFVKPVESKPPGDGIVCVEVRRTNSDTPLVLIQEEISVVDVHDFCEDYEANIGRL